MPVSKSPVGIKWLMLMAWRDSKRNHSRLLLFGSSIILGIAVLVAIYSLRENLEKNVDQQAATLLGADLEISGSKPATAVVQHIIDSVAADSTHERRFASMIYFPKNKGTRLVQVRALKGSFPYYGELETSPANAHKTFRNHRAVLLDKSLMLQYGARPGDSVLVGDIPFVIEGALTKAPGQTGLSASVSPVVYVPLMYIDNTELFQKGSRINYRYYLKLKSLVDVKQLVEKIEPRLETEGFYYDTIETQKEDTGRSFEDLTSYLELVGFIALLLGCIGVVSAIHIYVREKLGMIAILRCVGATSSQAFLIFLIQIIGITFICSIIGAAVGSLIQQLLPHILADLLPFEITATISWSSILQGVAMGMVISLLFALLPLISIRNISPLNTLRLSFQEKKFHRDPLKWLIYILIAVILYLLMYLQMHSWLKAFIFLASIAATFLLLAGVSVSLMWAVRRFLPGSWNYVWRQGISNLYRPNNQTFILVMGIGLGTAFMCTLFFIQSILINRVTLTSSGNQPNIVLFDIQTAQRDEVLSIAKSNGLPLMPTVPIVNMRLEQVNGVTAMDVQEDTTRDMAMRLFSREYRVTFRDTITTSEKIVSGQWRGKANPATGNIYISVEKGFASRFDLDIGDTMVFNVQGALVPVIIGSTREVDWNRLQANFLIVFPKGVLEEAPQFHVYLTRVPSEQTSVRFQQQIVQRFPNVSIIDLTLVLRVLDDLMAKIAFVIRFIAGFSIVTALVVLLISVLISRYQRIQENVLLRTLGASGRQILVITALEYFFLGFMSAAAGILISLGGSWALAHFTFETEFTPQLFPVIIIFLSICTITVVIGVMNSLSILNRPPLEVLVRA